MEQHTTHGQGEAGRTFASGDQGAGLTTPCVEATECSVAIEELSDALGKINEKGDLFRIESETWEYLKDKGYIEVIPGQDYRSRDQELGTQKRKLIGIARKREQLTELNTSLETLRGEKRTADLALAASGYIGRRGRRATAERLEGQVTAKEGQQQSLNTEVEELNAIEKSAGEEEKKLEAFASVRGEYVCLSETGTMLLQEYGELDPDALAQGDADAVEQALAPWKLREESHYKAILLTVIESALRQEKGPLANTLMKTHWSDLSADDFNQVLKAVPVESICERQGPEAVARLLPPFKGKLGEHYGELVRDFAVRVGVEHSQVVLGILEPASAGPVPAETSVESGLAAPPVIQGDLTLQPGFQEQVVTAFRQWLEAEPPQPEKVAELLQTAVTNPTDGQEWDKGTVGILASEAVEALMEEGEQVAANQLVQAIAWKMEEAAFSRLVERIGPLPTPEPAVQEDPETAAEEEGDYEYVEEEPFTTAPYREEEDSDIAAELEEAIGEPDWDRAAEILQESSESLSTDTVRNSISSVMEGLQQNNDCIETTYDAVKADLTASDRSGYLKDVVLERLSNSEEVAGILQGVDQELEDEALEFAKDLLREIYNEYDSDFDQALQDLSEMNEIAEVVEDVLEPLCESCDAVRFEALLDLLGEDPDSEQMQRLVEKMAGVCETETTPEIFRTIIGKLPDGVETDAIATLEGRAAAVELENGEDIDAVIETLRESQEQLGDSFRLAINAIGDRADEEESSLDRDQIGRIFMEFRENLG